MSGPATNEKSTARQDPEFDFWDFVGCTVCHLPFSSTDRGPPVPFWITECGHIICNSHLNPNQSCAKCGAQNIQLIPLQHNMDPPMSDWFHSLPHAIDGIAHAVKFQQESLASLIRHYRNQCLQLSSTCDRLRNERRSLRRDVEALQRELYEHRHKGIGVNQAQEPSAHSNHNGKRPMGEIRGQSGSVKTNSSPRSIPTPLGPLRLTLPRGEHPTFSRQEASGQEVAGSVDKPGSSRFAEQYAYHGENNLKMRPPPPRSLDVDHNMPPPPPTGRRFELAGQIYAHTDQTISSSSVQGFRPNRKDMGPPPIPQRPLSAVLQTPLRGTTQNATLQSNRLIPNSSHGRAFGPTAGGTSSAKGPASKFTNASSGQRMPFMPEGSRGFGL